MQFHWISVVAQQLLLLIIPAQLRMAPALEAERIPSSCDSQDGWCSFETVVHNDIWYVFEATPSGSVSITQGNTLDLQYAVWQVEDCLDYGTFTEIAANDDGGAVFAPQFDALDCLIPGETYYLQIDGFGGTSGTSDVTITDKGYAPFEVDAGGCSTVYSGYTAEYNETDLEGLASGGVPGYSYEWFDEENTSFSSDAMVTVAPSESTTYTLCATDERGCTVCDEVYVQVIDVTCGNNPKKPKIMVCHIPPGNNNNPQTICISPNAVEAHLAHGDFLGPCDAPDCDDGAGNLSMTMVNKEFLYSDFQEMELNVFPNPVLSVVNIDFSGSFEEDMDLVIYNSLGQTIYTQRLIGSNSFPLQLNTSELQLEDGWYIVSGKTESGVKVKKFVVAKQN